MKKYELVTLVEVLLVIWFTIVVVWAVSVTGVDAKGEPFQATPSPKQIAFISEPSPQIMETPSAVSVNTPAATPEPEPLLSDEEIELIALVTMGEAEGECEEGKRLVIDTILNRVDSPHFPDTVHDVVWQPNHFSVMWNGRMDRCSVQEDICRLVREELENRSNYDVIFFNAGHYSKYGTPLFQVEHHYFSSY